MNKRGSHVGVIVSFAVFVLFIVFLYSIFQPSLEFRQGKDILLDKIEGKILKNVTDNLIISSVRIKEVSDSSSCFTINSGLDSTSGLGSVVKTENAAIINSKILGGSLSVDESSPNGKFYRVFYSTSFVNSETLVGCTSLLETEYTIGSLRTEERVFENKIVDIVNYHISNYGALKDEIGLPAGNEFGVVFTDSDGKKITTGEVNFQGQVFAKDVPVQYVNAQGSTKNGQINIKVW